MSELFVAEGSCSTTLSLLMEHIDCAVITVLGATSVMLSKVVLEVISSMVLTAKHMFTITVTFHLVSLSEASLVAQAFHSVLAVALVAHAFQSVLTVATVTHMVASLVVSVLVHEASLITVVTFEMAFIFTTEVLNTAHLMFAIFAHHLVSTKFSHLISTDFTSHVAAVKLMSSGLVSKHLMSTELSVHGGLVSDSFVSDSLVS